MTVSKEADVLLQESVEKLPVTINAVVSFPSCPFGRLARLTVADPHIIARRDWQGLP